MDDRAFGVLERAAPGVQARLILRFRVWGLGFRVSGLGKMFFCLGAGVGRGLWFRFMV